MDKQIIVVKPNSLSPKDKEKLTKAGNIVIECEKGSEIIYRPFVESQYVYTNCSRCGERIYLLKERLDALKSGKWTFYCSYGHGQSYI